MSDYIIETSQLTKNFENIRAVDHINLRIQDSVIFGLLGPNGSGKTTTCRLLTGMLQPSKGTATVLGLDTLREGDLIREKTGILTETPSLYPRLTVRENLHFYAKVYDIPKVEIKNRVEELVDLFDISEKINEPAGTLSKGMKQKVALARSIIHNPELLFLDEPTSALAPESARMVRELILNLTEKENRTVFINTHNLEEAEKLCTQIGIIERGKLIALGTPAELRKRLQNEILTVISFSKWTKEIESYLDSKKAKVVEINKLDSSVSLKLEDIDEETPKLIKDLVNRNIGIKEVKHTRPTLERIYFELVNGDNSQEEDE